MERIIMNFEKFKKEILEGLKDQIGESYQVRLNHVIKNNGVELDGIIILRPMQKVAPNIYLESFYEEYRNGMPVKEIVNHILAVYFSHNHQIKSKKIQEIDALDLEKAENKIFYRLVNYKENQFRLSKIAYIRFLDMAITFHYLVDCNKNEVSSFHITKTLMKQWKITKTQLFDLANENTPKLFPAKLSNMNDIMTEILKRDVEKMIGKYGRVKENPQSEEEMGKRLRVKLEENSQEVQMFVLTNQMGINGASVVLYKNVVRNFAKICESDLYLLPSSIHEFIIVPKKEFIERKKLESMVKEVNRTQVEREEVLSDRVYQYRLKTNTFS